MSKMRTRHQDKSSGGSKSPSSSQNSNQHSSPEQNRHNPLKTTRAASNQHTYTEPVVYPPTPIGEVRATWTGKMFIVTGLRPDQFPIPKPDPSPGNQRGRRQRNTNGQHLMPLDLSPSKRSTASNNASPFRRSGLKRKRYGEDDDDAESLADGFGPDASQTSLRNGYDDYENADGTSGNLNDDPEDPSPTKRRRRGGRSQVESRVPSKAPSPELAIFGPEIDSLTDLDFPEAFLPDDAPPDPDDPDDEAQEIYRARYKPLPKAAPFLASLAKFNPAQRSTENLYAIAAHTQEALRMWQDEYIKIDKLTAFYALIQRKAATGSRGAIDDMVFEDMKEADIYDYTYDAKKTGFQNPVAQRVIRDASGRELRHRQQRGRIGADTQLLNAAAAAAAAAVASEEDGGRRRRAPKPVSKYDGVVPQEQQRRKRALDSAETEQPAKRGRTGARGGRGGKGTGRGGRGGSFIDKRVRDLREASAGFSTASVSGDDETGSEAGGMGSVYGESRESSIAPHPEDEEEATPFPDVENEPDVDDAEVDLEGDPDAELGAEDDADNDDGGELQPNGSAIDAAAAAAEAAVKRKGRPKGSKNLHARSDKGIPKGPRNKPKEANPADASPSTADQADGSANDASTAPRTKPVKGAAPKSEKRSQSMTEWWARRKAAKARDAAAALANAPPAPTPPVTSTPTTLAPQYAPMPPMQHHHQHHMYAPPPMHQPYGHMPMAFQPGYGWHGIPPNMPMGHIPPQHQHQHQHQYHHHLQQQQQPPPPPPPQGWGPPPPPQSHGRPPTERERETQREEEERRKRARPW